MTDDIILWTWLVGSLISIRPWAGVMAWNNAIGNRKPDSNDWMFAYLISGMTCWLWPVMVVVLTVSKMNFLAVGKEREYLKGQEPKPSRKVRRQMAGLKALNEQERECNLPLTTWEDYK